MPATPRPFEHISSIEDRILTIDHDIFLPFCSEASDPEASGDTDSNSAEV